MIFEIEEFDDLSKQSLDKLTKLRDRAAQNAMLSSRQAEEDRQRWIDITQEMERRK